MPSRSSRYLLCKKHWYSTDHHWTASLHQILIILADRHGSYITAQLSPPLSMPSGTVHTS